MKKRKVFLDDRVYLVTDIKQGGMGRVWLLLKEKQTSYDPIYSSQLAVKTFDFMNDIGLVERELNNWIGLDHRNILPLLKIGRLDFKVAAIMPFRFLTLQEHLDERGCLPEAEVHSVGCQLTEGLDYAFRDHGLVHLDLKPSNILVSMKDPIAIQVSDWGISRLSGLSSYATHTPLSASTEQTTFRAGTPLFMSPERYSGKWTISDRVDMYSLGMILLMLLTGVLPFQFGRTNPQHEIATHTYFENAQILLRGRNPKLSRIILACISPNPNERPLNYQSLKKMF